jgi:hypothetical protein
MFFHRFEIRWDHETGIAEGAIALLGVGEGAIALLETLQDRSPLDVGNVLASVRDSLG